MAEIKLNIRKSLGTLGYELPQELTALQRPLLILDRANTFCPC